MGGRTPSSSTKKPLPPPTKSEAAFERALAALSAREAQPVSAPSAGPPETAGSRDSFVDRAFTERERFLERDPYATIGRATQFFTKVVGVTFEGRQDTIAGLRDGSELELAREPANPYDPNAIAVRFGNLQLGYIKKEIAKHLAPLMDDGARYRARVSTLTGGPTAGDASRSRGVNLDIALDSAASVAARGREAGALRAEWTGDAGRVRAALIGEHQPHEAQRRVLERIEAGHNTLAVLATGRGKSFCFQYPAALRALAGSGKTLVIYPLRALTNDQYEGLSRRLETFGLRIYRANGSIPPDERAELFQALSEGAWDVILATPEFLAFHREHFSGISAPAMVVVDEAHHVHGSTHRTAYGSLGATIASLGAPQILALTATAGEAAFDAIVKDLVIDAWVIDPTIRENLSVVDARGTSDRTGYLANLFADRQAKGIVYTMSRSEATKVAEKLRAVYGNEVMFYHAGMPTVDRHEVERLFREGGLRIVVATSAFGEGIDLPDVRYVVLYHLNFNFTEFNQQAGRAGRDGAPAEIHLLYGDGDRRINEFLIDRGAPSIEVLRELYREIRKMARGGPLRMTFAEIARTLELDKADERTVAVALRMFEDEGLIEIAQDDDGRFVRFLESSGKIDLTKNERYAEGQAERENFKAFCDLALAARAEDLERIINRPIYPDGRPLVK
ncbi:MAG: helicase-related protein [Vulcanimicrobiaceae bacterium]